MKKFIYFTTALLLVAADCTAETHELKMSLFDTYTVQDTDKWSVSVKRYMPIRFAELRVLPKQEKKTFNLALYFYADTPDLAKYDTPKKMKSMLICSLEKYLPHIVEKEIKVEDISNKGWYGFKTMFTDADLVKVKSIPDDQYLYMIRGMIRLSEESALGFSLMTNDPKSAETKEVMDYIYSFAQEKKK